MTVVTLLKRCLTEPHSAPSTSCSASIAAALFLFIGLSPCHVAAQAADAAERLDAVRLATNLTHGELKPWYLKIDVQLMDVIGEPSGEATVEEWRGGETLNKIVYTTAKGKNTYLRKDGIRFRSEGYEYPGYFLEALLREVVNPIPFAKPVDGVVSKPQDFGKVKLDCLEAPPPDLQPASPHTLSSDLKPPVTRYCVSIEGDVLHAVLGSDGVNFVHNTLGRFQNRQVAVDVTAKAGNVLRGTAHVSALNSKPFAQDVFSAEGLVEQPSDSVQLNSGVIPGKILTKQQPVYPVAAKQRGIQGMVVIHAFIGKDGHVHSLDVLSAPSQDVGDAALEAVKRWTYQPFLLNGAPTEVGTIIKVEFALGLR